MTYKINTPDGKTITKNSKVNYTHAIIADGFKQKQFGTLQEEQWDGYRVLSTHKTGAAAASKLASFRGQTCDHGCVWNNLTLVEVN